MKALVVYYSKFGNTKRVAQTLADALRSGAEVRMVGLEQLAASDFEGVDLVVVGSPTHAFSVPPVVRSALAALPPGTLAGKSVAAFDTTVTLWPLRYLRASPKILRQLGGLGGKPIARPQTFFVKTSGTRQPGETDLLLAGQLDRAKDWARQILGQ